MQSMVLLRANNHDISNIMLLCQDCHKMIDREPEQFTTELLVDFKNKWESIVESTITAKAINHANVLRYAVPIGVHDFGVLDCDWRSSLASIRYAPFDKKPFDLYSDSLDHATHSSLDILADDLIRSFNRFSSTIKNDSLPTAVFAIAPQPLLVQLGYLLGGTRNSIVFQRRREKPHWQWSEECLPPEFAFELSATGTGEDAILIASISGDINDESLPVELMDSGCPIARFFVKAGGSVNSADSKAAAGLFRSGMDQVLYRIHEKYPPRAKASYFSCNAEFF